MKSTMHVAFSRHQSRLLTLKLLMGCQRFSLNVNSSAYFPLPLCCTRASTFANSPDCSSVRRSCDSSEREHTKPGWQFSPANNSSCTHTARCHPHSLALMDFLIGSTSSQIWGSWVMLHLSGDSWPNRKPVGLDLGAEEGSLRQVGVVLIVVITLLPCLAAFALLLLSACSVLCCLVLSLFLIVLILVIVLLVLLVTVTASD